MFTTTTTSVRQTSFLYTTHGHFGFMWFILAVFIICRQKTFEEMKLKLKLFLSFFLAASIHHGRWQLLTATLFISPAQQSCGHVTSIQIRLSGSSSGTHSHRICPSWVSVSLLRSSELLTCRYRWSPPVQAPHQAWE